MRPCCVLPRGPLPALLKKTTTCEKAQEQGTSATYRHVPVLKAQQNSTSLHSLSPFDFSSVVPSCKQERFALQANDCLSDLSSSDFVSSTCPSGLLKGGFPAWRLSWVSCHVHALSQRSTQEGSSITLANYTMNEAQQLDSEDEAGQAQPRLVGWSRRSGRSQTSLVPL